MRKPLQQLYEGQFCVIFFHDSNFKVGRLDCVATVASLLPKSARLVVNPARLSQDHSMSHQSLQLPPTADLKGRQCRT